MDAWSGGRLRRWKLAILRVLSYEGLPPEVGAFKSEKGVHAPWPVHNFGHFRHFWGIFDSRGVGVIPWVPGWMVGDGGDGCVTERLAHANRWMNVRRVAVTTLVS